MSGAVPGYVSSSQRSRAAKRQVVQPQRLPVQAQRYVSDDFQPVTHKQAQENEARGLCSMLV